MSRTLSDPRLEHIPEHVAERLTQLFRRARTVAAAKGAAWTVGTLIVGMILAVAIDWVVPMLFPPTAVYFNPATRIGITLTVLAVTGLVAWWKLVRPLRRRYSLTTLAMALESGRPDLQERITTTVELAGQAGGDTFRGSEAMIAKVAEAADADSAQINPEQVIGSQRAVRLAVAAGLIVVAVIGVAAAWPSHFSLYVQRFVTPWTDTAQYRRTEVRSLTESALVARRDRLVIKAETTGLRADRATLYLEYESGRYEPPVTVSAAADGLFHFEFSSVRESFTYRIRANDGVTRTWQVTAVERPEVSRIDLHLDYPDYTGQPDSDRADALGAVEAIRHTRVTVRLTTNRSLDTGESALVLRTDSGLAASVTRGSDEAEASNTPAESHDERIPLTRLDDGRYEATFEVLQSGTWHADLSAGGMRNLLTAERQPRIVAVPDKAPWVKIGRPTGQVKLRPDDKLPIHFEAADDVGLSLLRIRYSVDGREFQTVDVPGGEGMGSAHRGRAVFDLAELPDDLKAAIRIEYQLQVADTLPEHFGGPQWGLSSRQTILLEAKVGDYADRMIATMREEFADEVANLDKELREAQADVGAVLKRMAKVKDLDEQQERKTDEAIEHLVKANELALKAAGNTEYSQYERMGQRLKDIAAAHIQPARALTAQSKDLSVQPEPRRDKLTQAEWHIQRALEKLNAVSNEFTDLIKLEERTEELFDLADKQEEIAQKAGDDEVVNDPKELAELTKEQMNLLDKTRQMLLQEEGDNKPLFDIAEAAETTLEDEISKVEKQQKELAEQTAAGQELADLEKKLDGLAKEQQDLAEKAEKLEKIDAEALKQAETADKSAEAMKQAADSIQQREMEQAIAQQDEAVERLEKAETATEKQAKEEADAVQDARDATNEAGMDKEIARQARDLQKKQQELAEETEKAAADARKQQAEADAAARQAESESLALAKKQADLAKQFEKMQSDAQKSLPKDDAAQAARRDGTPQAKAAAEELKKNDPKSAERQARTATDKAEDLAKAMQQVAKDHDAAAKKAAAAAAAEKDDEKKKAARAQAEQEQKHADAARKVADDASKVADAQKKLADQMKSASDTQAKAEQAAAEADKSRKKLDELAGKQEHQARQVKQIEEGMKRRTENQRALAKEHNPSKPAAEAGKSLPKNPEQAQKQQAEAAQKLGQMADALDKSAAENKKQGDAIQEPYQRMQQQKTANRHASDLKAQQKKLTEQTREAAEQYEKARQQLAEQQRQRIAAEQKQLAKEAAELADAVAQPAVPPAPPAGGEPPAEQPKPQPNPSATRAAAAAGQAARELAKPELPAAREQQEQAAKDLEKLAGEMLDQSDAEAGVDPQAQQVRAAQAQQAARLAQRQQALAEQVKNLEAGKPLANLPIQQQQLEQETRELGEKAKMVADFIEPIDPEAGKLAQQAAAKLAEQAPQHQAQAAEQMQQGELPKAQQQQQAAAKAAGEAREMFQQAAAKAAEQLANAPADAQQPQDQPQPGEAAQQGEQNPSDPLADAAWAQRQAQAAMQQAQQAQQGEQSLAQQLAQAQAQLAAQQASEQLSQAAQQSAQQAMSMSGVLSLSTRFEQIKLFSPGQDPKTGSGLGPSDLQRLNFELGISQAEWNRLPGYIQHEIVQASDEKVPQEYRELVKRYFRTISQQVGENPIRPPAAQE